MSHSAASPSRKVTVRNRLMVLEAGGICDMVGFRCSLTALMRWEVAVLGLVQYARVLSVYHTVCYGDPSFLTKNSSLKVT